MMLKISEGEGFLQTAADALLGPKQIQDEIQGYAKKLKTQPGFAKTEGKSMVTGMGAGGKSTSLSGAIGSAVASELPNSPRLDMMPKIFMGFQQGGFGGGMKQLGSAISSGMNSLFGEKQGRFADNLPPGIIQQVGDKFKGSVAARSAADTVAPAVNRTFDHVIDNSMFGKGLKMLADPRAYIEDKAKELGMGPMSPTGATKPGGAGGTT